MKGLFEEDSVAESTSQPLGHHVAGVNKSTFILYAAWGETGPVVPGQDSGNE
jgi:hypothetical protein